MKEKIFIIFFLIVLIPIFCIGKYCKKIENVKIGFELLEPILEIEACQNTIKKDILNNSNNLEEFIFIIKNYNSLKDDKITELKLSYNIELKISNEYLLEKCEIYNMETGEELLNGRYKTNDIIVEKDIKYEEKYKLFIKLKNNEEYKDEKLNIEIVLNSSQEI